MSEGYRAFVRGELDRFAAANPGMLRAILTALTAGSVARPVLTLALFGAGAAAVPAAAGVIHHVIDVGVTFGAPLAGEASVAVASQGIRPLVERLFAGWSAERVNILTETIRDVVLGDCVEQVGRLAAAAPAPNNASVSTACATECR